MTDPTSGSTTRDAVAAHVRTNPGVHFNELARALDIAPGQAQYHVKRLRRAGDLVAEEVYGQTHYFPPAYDPGERRAVALLRRETAADVVTTLLTAGPTPAAEVADRVGIARSTLSWHVDRLVEQDLVEKRRDARNRVTLELVDPQRTADLLATVEPSLPERLVDRFTRLVDSLLAE